jgi:hypothetical protein
VDAAKRHPSRDVSISHQLQNNITHFRTFLSTSSKEDRIKEYLDTANVPPLTAEEIKAIEDSGSKFYKRVFVSYRATLCGLNTDGMVYRTKSE